MFMRLCNNLQFNLLLQHKWIPDVFLISDGHVCALGGEWLLVTELYKFVWDIWINNSSTGHCLDLTLGLVVSLSIFSERQILNII